jgi:hypothetical protein
VQQRQLIADVHPDLELIQFVERGITGHLDDPIPAIDPHQTRMGLRDQEPAQVTTDREW